MANLQFSDRDKDEFLTLARFALSIKFPDDPLENGDSYNDKIGELLGLSTITVYIQIFNPVDKPPSISRKTFDTFCLKYDEVIGQITLPIHKAQLPKHRKIYLEWKNRLLNRFKKRELLLKPVIEKQSVQTPIKQDRETIDQSTTLNNDFLPFLQNTIWTCFELPPDSPFDKFPYRDTKDLIQSKLEFLPGDNSNSLKVKYTLENKTKVLEGEATYIRTGNLLSITLHRNFKDQVRLDLILDDRLNNTERIIGFKLYNEAKKKELVSQVVVLDKKELDDDDDYWLEATMGALESLKADSISLPVIPPVHDLDSFAAWIEKDKLSSNLYPLIRGPYHVFFRNGTNMIVDEIRIFHYFDGKLNVLYKSLIPEEQYWKGRIKENFDNFSFELTGPRLSHIRTALRDEYNEPLFLLFHSPKTSDYPELLCGMIAGHTKSMGQFCSSLIAISEGKTQLNELKPIAEKYLDKFKIGTRPELFGKVVTKLEELKSLLD